MRTLIITFFILLANSSWSTESAYNKLRNDYEKAQKPTYVQLMPGRTWYCSGSLEAAKRLFRYVPLWNPYFNFSMNTFSKLLNAGPTSTGELTELENEWRTSRGNEYLRVNIEGDLLLEVTEYNFNLFGFYVSYKASFSDPYKDAVMYQICENPKTHDDPDWQRGGYWSNPAEP